MNVLKSIKLKKLFSLKQSYLKAICKLLIILIACYLAYIISYHISYDKALYRYSNNIESISE